MPSSTHFVLGLPGSLLAATACNANASPPRLVPAPLFDAPRAAASTRQTAVLSGGCFWPVQAVFQHVSGVITSTSGYAGGSANTAEYETVSTGETGHAESVEIVYDPSQITYGELLRVFFSVAHDSTQLNRQGPDDGTQYRSSILYTSDEQKKVAEAYSAQLDKTRVFSAASSRRLLLCRPFIPPKRITKTMQPYTRISLTSSLTARRRLRT